MKYEKPAVQRFGSLRELFACYDYCAQKGIEMYGGGQSELGPGRGQIQYLASLTQPSSSPRQPDEKDASFLAFARLASGSLKLIPYKAIAHFISCKE